MRPWAVIPVVGIGASAGWLEIFKRLLGGLGDFGSAGFAGNSVPEPGTVPLLCLGLLALTLHGHSRKRGA